MDFTPEELVRIAISSWNRRDLAQFAEARIGYHNTDIGCGITYEHDLDDYDRYVDGFAIPVGYVRASADWGALEVNVPERTYLQILAEELEAAGLTEDAARVIRLATPE